MRKRLSHWGCWNQSSLNSMAWADVSLFPSRVVVRVWDLDKAACSLDILSEGAWKQFLLLPSVLSSELPTLDIIWLLPPIAPNIRFRAVFSCIFLYYFLVFSPFSFPFLFPTGLTSACPATLAPTYPQAGSLLLLLLTELCHWLPPESTGEWSLFGHTLRGAACPGAGLTLDFSEGESSTPCGKWLPSSRSDMLFPMLCLPVLPPPSLSILFFPLTSFKERCLN